MIIITINNILDNKTYFIYSFFFIETILKIIVTQTNLFY